MALDTTTILVVEDEPSSREAEASRRRGAGYQVTMVRDGEAALDALSRSLPDLVILDLMLPKIDGFDRSSEVAPPSLMSRWARWRAASIY